MATCVCQLLKGWDKLPESILRVSVEIIPLCSEELSHTEVSDVLPTLGKIIQKYAHMSEAVARLCEQRALAVPVSQVGHCTLNCQQDFTILGASDINKGENLNCITAKSLVPWVFKDLRPYMLLAIG